MSRANCWVYRDAREFHRRIRCWWTTPEDLAHMAIVKALRYGLRDDIVGSTPSFIARKSASQEFVREVKRHYRTVNVYNNARDMWIEMHRRPERVRVLAWLIISELPPVDLVQDELSRALLSMILDSSNYWRWHCDRYTAKFRVRDPSLTTIAKFLDDTPYMIRKAANRVKRQMLKEVILNERVV